MAFLPIYGKSYRIKFVYEKVAHTNTVRQHLIKTNSLTHGKKIVHFLMNLNQALEIQKYCKCNATKSSNESDLMTQNLASSLFRKREKRLSYNN